MGEERDFPLKQGAVCGCCMGPVDGFGCVAQCEESQTYRIDLFAGAREAPDAERLKTIAAHCEQVIRSTRPEFVSEAIFHIYEIARRTNTSKETSGE